jgi:hypothetical protein
MPKVLASQAIGLVLKLLLERGIVTATCAE